MPTYRVSGFVFASAIAFDELPRVRRVRPDCALTLSRAAIAPARPSWYHAWERRDGSAWARFARLSSGYLVRFPRLCDFVIAHGAARIRCRVGRGTPMATVRHLFLNQVLPLALGERGDLVLHASAVLTPRGAVAFLGGTGAGKSTLAAGFARAGDTLVADDCLRVEVRRGVVRAVPSYPALRLWPDAADELGGLPGHTPRTAHCSAKLRVPALASAFRFTHRSVPLVKAYVLDRPRASPRADPAIGALYGRTALAELIGHLFRLDVGRRATLRRDFDRLAGLARRLPMARLNPARGLSRLPMVRAAVLADLGGLQ